MPPSLLPALFADRRAEGVRWSPEFGQAFKLGLLLRRTDRNDEQTEAVADVAGASGRLHPTRLRDPVRPGESSI
jgi:hypothetical protein